MLGKQICSFKILYTVPSFTSPTFSRERSSAVEQRFQILLVTLGAVIPLLYLTVDPATHFFQEETRGQGHKIYPEGKKEWKEEESEKILLQIHCCNSTL